MGHRPLGPPGSASAFHLICTTLPSAKVFFKRIGTIDNNLCSLVGNKAGHRCPIYCTAFHCVVIVIHDPWGSIQMRSDYWASNNQCVSSNKISFLVCPHSACGYTNLGPKVQCKRLKYCLLFIVIVIIFSSGGICSCHLCLSPLQNILKISSEITS